MIVAGIAAAFKLYDQTVPNNVLRDASNFDYVVEVLRPTPANPEIKDWVLASAGNPIFPAGQDQYPGDTRTEDVRLTNTQRQPEKDASFHVYVPPQSIKVFSCTSVTAQGQCVGEKEELPTLPTGFPNTRYSEFLGMWTLRADKELVAHAAGNEANENDHALPTTDPGDLGDHDASGNRQYGVACEGGLKTFTIGQPCNLGIIRKSGSAELNADGTLQPLDQRWYKFNMIEKNEDRDQSVFKGWRVSFSLVFVARVPPAPESSAVPAGQR